MDDDADVPQHHVLQLALGAEKGHQGWGHLPQERFLHGFILNPAKLADDDLHFETRVQVCQMPCTFKSYTPNLTKAIVGAKGALSVRFVPRPCEISDFGAHFGKKDASQLCLTIM